MYSFPNLEPFCCSMSRSNYCFLNCIQISQEASKVVWNSHLPKNFPSLLWSTQSRFWHVNKAEVDVFLELSCFFDYPTDFGNLISGSSAFSNCSLNIWNYMVHILLKSGLENFEHYFASVWDECNCLVVWKLFTLPFLGIGMKTDIFQSCSHCWVFQICWPIEYSIFTAFFRILNFRILDLK